MYPQNKLHIMYKAKKTMRRMCVMCARARAKNFVYRATLRKEPKNQKEGRKESHTGN